MCNYRGNDKIFGHQDINASLKCKNREEEINSLAAWTSPDTSISRIRVSVTLDGFVESGEQKQVLHYNENSHRVPRNFPRILIRVTSGNIIYKNVSLQEERNTNATRNLQFHVSTTTFTTKTYDFYLSLYFSRFDKIFCINFHHFSSKKKKKKKEIQSSDIVLIEYNICDLSESTLRKNGTKNFIVILFDPASTQIS